MKENLKKFLEEASKNEDLKAKLTAINDRDTAVAKAIELAKEYGITLTAEDFKPDEGDELSLDEMDQVAGGWCFYQGKGGCGMVSSMASQPCTNPGIEYTRDSI